MYRKFVSVLVGTILFSSAQAASTTSSTKTKVGPVEFTSSFLAQEGDHQVTLQPSALLLLSVGLFGIVAVARRETT